MPNPNNHCEYCEHKQVVVESGAHCYMFKVEPDELCMRHTCYSKMPGRKTLEQTVDFLMLLGYPDRIK